MRKICFLIFICMLHFTVSAQNKQPNVVIIYTDDVGYGDLSFYGATDLQTPHIDKLANTGLKFTNAYATNATCTPSRYSLLTGVYAWRKKGTGVAAGNASLIIDENQLTIADVFKNAGYATGVIGKWHLGLGGKEGPDWNGTITPGPKELGFDYSYIMAATNDRVPCVYVEGNKVANLDPTDPIVVDYQKPIADANIPTYKEHPEMLTTTSSHGHDYSIINGIGRIGYMSGGRTALWDDYTMNKEFAERAKEFIIQNKNKPFFLYWATPTIHVPRTPHKDFAGKSGMGPRGDVILELDFSVGQIMKALDSLGLRENTLIVFSSDNGPVVDDGYNDQAVELLGKHKPAGKLRGGKYSIFEGGTKVPFIVNWQGNVKKGSSGSLFSQIDLLRSFAALTGQQIKSSDASDSFDRLKQLLGKSAAHRPFLIQNAHGMGIVMNDWKYILPNNHAVYNKHTDIELGNNPQPQLYNLQKDIGEKNNLAGKYKKRVEQLHNKLKQEMDKGYLQ